MKKTTTFLVLILIFAVQSFAFALTKWPEPKPPGYLSVTVVASASAQYLSDWVDPNMKNKVSIKRIREIKVQQIAYCGFIITGLSPSPDPLSSLKYSVGFKLYGPNGSLLYHEPNYTSGQFQDPKTPTYIMADPALDLTFEDSDQAGIYTIEGIVTDLITGKKATHKYEITLVK